MASQISIGKIKPGQMLWALSSPRPYWPSIVCKFASKEAAEDGSVYVKFCVSKESSWVHLDNVFEFNGHPSFIAKKQYMKSVSLNQFKVHLNRFSFYSSFFFLLLFVLQKMTKEEFDKAFDVSSNEDWRKAVTEATLLMTIKSNLTFRLCVFDLLNLK